MKPALFRCCGIALLLALPSSGNVTVTTTADENNGSLDPGVGAGTSLREAVALAPAGSVIDFAPGLSGQTITLGGSQISFGKNLSLDASALAGGVIVSGNDASRVFDIPSSRVVAMIRMKIVHGDSSGDGGGIRNAGTLSLTDCELTDHHADDGGGSIENSGPLTATACTFAGNTAEVGGGAIEHTANTLVLINCTLAGNTADFGGAIDGDGTSTIQLRSCTVSGNHATSDGGGIEETTGTLVLENSIVAGNTADDEGDDLKASGINTETGKNLLSSTGGLGGSFSGIVAPPQLSALGAYGGFTRTMPPLAGSAAINAGGSTTLTVDQRGLPRVVSTVDIGSVEIQASNQVTTTADSGSGSLRQVVQDAPAGATVTFAAALDLATITLASPIVLGKNLTLDAADRDDLTISGGDASGLFTVNAGVSVVMAGLNLRDGTQPAGGAIRNLGSLALTDCVVSSSFAYTGGGVSNAAGAILTLTDCELAQNLASQDGGGLHNQGTATLTRVTVVGNGAGEEAGSGGGIYSTGVLTLIESVVNANGAPSGGGMLSSGTVTLDRVSVLNNDAWDGSGGGLVASGNGGTINASTFSENRCIGSGGGLYHGGGDLTIINSTWAGNVAEYEFGGAIAARAPDDLLDVVSCTFSDNEAGEEGGGIFVETGSRLRLENSILSSNTAATAGADLRGAIETQAGVNLVSSSAGIDGSFGGIIAPSLLGALADHGGPTWTILPAAGSPAIDAGGPTSLIVDQRGLPRVVGGTVDLGAVEVQGEDVAEAWEILPAPPFPHGVGAGGGLATDGSFLYAADLSGDGDFDFIDLDDDGVHDAGEGLAALGIANASVRFARFDPADGTWQTLPSLVPGFSGDALSRINFNGGLFHAAGYLYYYQFRSGANRCVLHRYHLATAPAGGWEQVWDKDTASALLEPSAGMTAVETASGPVLLHHRGGGSFDFCRTTVADGGSHVVLTPTWPFDTATFPRNCSWEYDRHSGWLFHLAGDQLLAWSPSATYPGASFLTTVPIAGNPLATFHTPVASLKSQLGWEPGGNATHPGASVWGNSLTMVNAPTFHFSGPDGEDSGANVLYLVRGETTVDSWPFNEGRGRITNGDFARYFPATGQVQTLDDAPFLIGKGSDSVYLDGCLYLTQGETRTSADGAGNDFPINADGLRRPGGGIARFRVRAGDYTTGEPVIPLADYLPARFADAATSPLASGETADLFDRDWNSGVVTAAVNPAVVDVTFTDATPTGAARAAFGPGSHEWSLVAANTAADLASESGSFVVVFGPLAVAGEGPHWQEWNDTPVTRRIFRFTARNLAGSSVEIRELELQRPKVARTVDLGGEVVAVNHLQILPDAPQLALGESLDLSAELSLSLGPDRHDVTVGAGWSSSDPAVATVDAAGHLVALAEGQTSITASFQGFIGTTVVTVAGTACEPVALSVEDVSLAGIHLRSTPLVASSYELQASSDLIHWRNTGVVFSPLQQEHVVAHPGEARQFYRLACSLSLDLALADSQATALTLNWPPRPGAMLYKVFRDDVLVGSTVGKFGYFTDYGLPPGSTHDFRVEAYGTADQLLGMSETRGFTTAATSRVRTRYQQLGLAFYPSGPDAGFPAIRSYFHHRTDFIRLASANTAILEPFGGDVVVVQATPPILAGGSSVDYVALSETRYPELGGCSIVDLVERGDVDVVNVVAFAGVPFGENAFIGNKGRNVGGAGQSWVALPARCSRSFFMNANTADARAYDAFAHCAEGVMSTACDGHPDAWPRGDTYQVYTTNILDFTTLLIRNLNLFERFRLADQWNGTSAVAYASPGNGNCGSSHFPPTSRRDTDAGYDGDYAYYDRKSWQRYIDCAADDWLAFPNLTGATRKLNGYDYGAFNRYTQGQAAYGPALGISPELHSSFTTLSASFHQWWFFHLPHNAGVASGRLNNWWPYLFDHMVFDGSSVGYPLAGMAEIPTSFPPVGGESGTELADATWWGYWSSFASFGPHGTISAVNAAGDPGTVRQGQYALKVEVDQQDEQELGRNDAFYPISRNARWNLAALSEIGVSLKLVENPQFVTGANPVVRLCTHGGNRIEFAPLHAGVYANHFLDPAFQAGGGWFSFDIPVDGSADWEVNVIGYIDPTLDPSQWAAAKQQLKEDILSEVNYVEVSIRSDGGPGQRVVFLIDGLEFR